MLPKFPYSRKPHWSKDFINFLRHSRMQSDNLRLDWTNVTCISWCCEGIEAITGHNPYEEFRQEVSSVRTAANAITARGYDTLDQLIGSYWKEVPVGMAQTGDLVLIQSDWVEEDMILKRIMPFGVGLADPPLYWCVTPEGLGNGDLYAHGHSAFAVGREI